jgi:hypothetical protein
MKNFNIEIIETKRATKIVGTLSESEKMTITVYHPDQEFGAMAPAKINWPALGAMTVNGTLCFIQAMTVAVQKAAELNSAAGL